MGQSIGQVEEFMDMLRREGLPPEVALFVQLVAEAVVETLDDTPNNTARKKKCALGVLLTTRRRGYI